MASVRDHLRYQGAAELHFVGFDEASQIPSQAAGDIFTPVSANPKLTPSLRGIDWLAILVTCPMTGSRIPTSPARTGVMSCTYLA